MKTIAVTRPIAASPDAVWVKLTDARALVEGGTGIERIEGRVAPQARFTLYATVAPGRGFKIRVAAFEAPKRMVWTSGQWPFFQGRRTFMLTPIDGGTRFEMTEVFTGLMLPLIWRSMPDLQPSFDQFADALARLTEGQPT